MNGGSNIAFYSQHSKLANHKDLFSPKRRKLNLFSDPNSPRNNQESELRMKHFMKKTENWDQWEKCGPSGVDSSLKSERQLEPCVSRNSFENLNVRLSKSFLPAIQTVKNHKFGLRFLQSNDLGEFLEQRKQEKYT